MAGYVSGRTSLTTVQSGDIAADAVTLAKMAAGTDGNLITYDASGDPAAVATGSDGEVLTSAGAGQPPAFEAAAGGGFVYIATVTASNASSADFDTNLTSTYGMYLLLGYDMNPATDNIEWYIRTGDTGGYDTGSTDYSYALIGRHASASYSTNSTGDNNIIVGALVGDVGTGNAAAEAGSLICWIANPSGTTYRKHIKTSMTFADTDGDCMTVETGGSRDATAAIDRIQILSSSGNIDGVFRLYGVVNS